MPKSTYMYWQKNFDKELSKEVINIENRIKDLRSQHENWGYRRIYGQMRKEGFVINHKRVQKIIQKYKLQVTSFTRKTRKYNSYQGTVGKVADNLLNRNFNTNIPHQKITTDTTEFKYRVINSKGRVEIKKLYLDPFMDLYNREIISYRISPKPTAKNILSALDDAIKITNDCQHRRIFHSDQGWGYQMNAYIHALENNNILQSMSRKGNCHDNAVMENFFGLLKQEIYYGHEYNSYEELETAIIKYIKYYNEERIKEKLNWMSPVEYRLANLAA